MKTFLYKSILFLTLSLVALASKAQVTYTVSNTNSDGAGSLKDAISQSNSTPVADKIVFSSAIAGSTITLFSETITNTVTIDGETRNITILGFGSFRIQSTAVNTTIKNLTIKNATTFAGIFLLTGCQGVVVDNCTLINCTHGIMVNKGNNITIKNCKIGVAGTAQAASDVVPNYDGIVLNNSTNVTISNNVISGNYFKGIWIRGTKPYNPMKYADTPNESVLGESSIITIDGNKIGVNANGTVKLPNQDGIFVEGSYDLVIKNNMISGNRSVGLNLDQNVGNAEITNNVIGSNTLGSDIGNNYGVVIRSSHDIQLGTPSVGNTIYGNTTVGVEVPASKNGIEIFNNLIGSNSTANTKTDTGIVIKEGSQKVLVKKNKVANNDKQGVVVKDNSYYNKISENEISFNTVPGIKLANNGNFLKEKPLITDFVYNGFRSVTVKGTAAPNDTVEIFKSDSDLSLKNALEFLGKGVADQSGRFSVKVFSFFDNVGYAYFVATATDKAGNTSELSDVFKAVCQADFTISLFPTLPDCGECNGSIEAVLSKNGYFEYSWYTPCRSSWKEGDDRTALGSNTIINNLCEGAYVVHVRDLSTGCGTSECIDLVPREEHECNGCVSSFAPSEAKDYEISVWVKEVQSIGQPIDSFPSPHLTVEFIGASASVTFPTSGRIIDGWQKIKGTFSIPGFTSEISIKLENNGTNAVYFDDIRVQPLNANMETYVYDPLTLKLVAKLDENNYATLYEYDEEGKLVRVKKETERGIMTIQESRENVSKIKQP